MVLSIENSTEIASFHHTLFPYCWSHQVCSRPFFRIDKESLQSHLRFVALRICAACRDLKHYWTKQSTGEWLFLCTTGVHFTGSSSKSCRTLRSFIIFGFSNKTPGMVYKEFLSSPEQSFMLLKNNAILPPPLTLPDIINPDGLTEEPRNYLFREIRQFCKPGMEDIVAPAP